jgi:hypothetical protein
MDQCFGLLDVGQKTPELLSSLSEPLQPRNIDQVDGSIDHSAECLSCRYQAAVVRIIDIRCWLLQAGLVVKTLLATQLKSVGFPGIGQSVMPHFSPITQVLLSAKIVTRSEMIMIGEKSNHSLDGARVYDSGIVSLLR